MNNDFLKTKKTFFENLTSHKIMVLSTSADSRVSSRTVSVIIHNGKFYFQTDENYLKFKQLSVNPNAAFCFDYYSVEGICKCIGKPTDDQNSFFIELFKEHFSASYELYSKLDTERLIEFTPKLIYCWGYDNSKPFIEYWDFENQKYNKEYQYGF